LQKGSASHGSCEQKTRFGDDVSASDNPQRFKKSLLKPMDGIKAGRTANLARRFSKATVEFTQFPPFFSFLFLLFAPIRKNIGFTTIGETFESWRARFDLKNLRF